MLIKRNALEKIEKYMKRKEIIAITGARQIGKTTILKHFYNKIESTAKTLITFNDLQVLNMFDSSIELFIEKYILNKEYLFIDEIQYSKKSGQLLKLIYDKYNIKIVISGSSKSEIAINSLKYLVGRVLIINLFPLSFEETTDEFNNDNYFLFKQIRPFKELQLLDHAFSKYLAFGGYPEIVLESDLELKEDILKNIVNTYLLKEIKDILNYKNVTEFEKVLIRLAITDGGILNYNSIAKDFGIHNNRVSEIVSTLEKTTILNIVKPFHSNKTKELIKSPKTFFFDLGFKNTLIKNYNSLELRADKGQIYENFILNSFIKNNLNPTYWNLKNAFEMDFVLETNGEIIGVEVKSKLVHPKITKSIKKFIDIIKPSKVYVFCENQDIHLEYNNCKVEFTHYLNIFKIIQEIKHKESSADSNTTTRTATL